MNGSSYLIYHHCPDGRATRLEWTVMHVGYSTSSGSSFLRLLSKLSLILGSAIIQMLSYTKVSEGESPAKEFCIYILHG